MTVLSRVHNLFFASFGEDHKLPRAEVLDAYREKWRTRTGVDTQNEIKLNRDSQSHTIKLKSRQTKH